MKRILLVLACSAMFSVAKAEGYQVNLQSARQTGMGHTGVAQKLGAESQFFNPAGLAFMQKSIDLSAGFSAVFAKATYTDAVGIESVNNVQPSTPMYAYAAFKVSDKFSFGISMNTPYGSTLDWGKDWAGAHLIQKISLQAFNAQPTIAYRICDNLSIGAGLMIGWGSVELSRGLMPVGSFTGFEDLTPVSAMLTGDAKVALGYNVGLMYDVNKRLTIGASYRSKVMMEVEEGTANVDYASQVVENTVGLVGDAYKTAIASGDAAAIAAAMSNQLFPVWATTQTMKTGTFTAEMPMPANLTFGASYDINDKLEVAADVQITFWNAYDSLNIAFTPSSIPAIKSPKHYDNSFAIRLGAEYALTERTDLRAGIYFDQTPIQENNYNPETPGMNKIGTSIGASFRPVENFSIDFAFLYIAGLGQDGSVIDPVNPTVPFAGKYTNHAIAPTLGISYSF